MLSSATRSSYNVRSRIVCGFDVPGALDTKLLDFQDRESVFALDRLYMTLSPFRLFLDPHRLTLHTHYHGSAHEQPLIQIRVLSLRNVRDVMRGEKARLR